MEEPFFSVIIPLYNREELIQTTIQSVLNQDTKKSFEVIVVDDGSTDASAEKVRELLDSRVRYIYQNNSGANIARNHGIDVARGKYVAMLDSDDLYMKDHLSSSATVLDTNPNCVVYAKIVVNRGEGKTFLKPPRSILKDEHMSDYLLSDRGFLQTSTLVLPTDLARKVRFDDNLPFGQDTDFAIRLYAEGASFHMKELPAVVWRDVYDGKRISSKSRPEVREKWLEKVKPIITRKAFYADNGWFVAKSYVQKGDYFKGIKLYLNAVVRGCYSPQLSVVIGLQIFLPKSVYRAIVDRAIKSKQNK
ncbi:glycosyltransferase family 2 protein [Dyadobacter sp. CY323]|uniref:glycosyltransferase family 2 protein n=1 Tax=Dyadobacter sp. CY323 TaxID=2907302 RepID=UPI001F1BC4C7|nr:glycosyltransferase family 2 protein [Dyadobacter sp. CY323]MCE6992750.1 glycosyltransferase [Dyadobacter sp. CY323]